MATLYGVNRTKANDPSASNIMKPGVQQGKIRVIMDTREAVAVDIADIIQMGMKLPKGAKVVETVLTTDALGSSVTLSVGDYETPARYISAAECNTAEQVTRMNVIDGKQYEVDETTPGATTTDRQVIITVAGAAASGTIKLEVYYTNE